MAYQSLSTTNTEIGAVNETAPATDTASSGLNGRGQRIAQRITSLIALLPAALVSGRLDVNLGAAPATVTGQGDVAHDGVDSGNPVKIGGVALAHGANPTAVAAGDRVQFAANRHGVPFHIGGHPNIVNYTQNFTTAQTDTALVTVSTGTIIVCTGFMITCSNATSPNVSARLGFGTASVPAYGNTGIIGSHPGIAPGSGFGRGGGAGMVGEGGDGEDLRVTISVPTGGSCDATVTYYTIPS